MEKINKINSLKWRVLLYFPIPFALAVFGTYAIGYGSNELQTLYKDKFYIRNTIENVCEVIKPYAYEIHYNASGEENYVIYTDENGSTNIIAIEDHMVPQGMLEYVGYIAVSNAQIILIPLWIMFCISVASYLFYKREMERGLNTLMCSAKKISQNELDFVVETTKKNEIGLVCDAFEKMRKSLLQTYKENMKMTEEARRLNAAFSHDIRTPITVMKGYIDLLERYVPEGKVSREKELEILKLMHKQADRLEKHTELMSSVQKLEDIVPNRESESICRITKEIQNTCRLIDERVKVSLNKADDGRENILIDRKMLFEVVENLVSNAARYAEEEIEVDITIDGEFLRITVRDDGAGFSEKILKKAGSPFLREVGEEDKQHFGLGIYISGLLCEKCGGSLSLENKNGAFASASFQIN